MWYTMTIRINRVRHATTNQFGTLDLRVGEQWRYGTGFGAHGSIPLSTVSAIHHKTHTSILRAMTARYERLHDDHHEERHAHPQRHDHRIDVVVKRVWQCNWTDVQLGHIRVAGEKTLTNEQLVQSQLTTNLYRRQLAHRQIDYHKTYALIQRGLSRHLHRVRLQYDSYSIIYGRFYPINSVGINECFHRLLFQQPRWQRSIPTEIINMY